MPQQPGKPGTACLGCRRRKVKCSREPEACQNCIKFDLPCVYPAPEVGVKRKRGPYKKDKAPRERHLEDLVKYLQPNHSGDNERLESSSTDEDEQSAPSIHTPVDTKPGPRKSSAPKAPSPQDLVKDALVALTNTSSIRREDQDDTNLQPVKPITSKIRRDSGKSLHPPVRRIFEYWYIYALRVDPLVKLIHVPTFAKKLFYIVDDLSAIPASTEAMLYSIYFAVVCSCTPRETRYRFGENRNVLKQRYGRALETALADNYGVPVMELIQALVLYLVSL